MKTEKNWIYSFKLYFSTIFIGNLIWEFSHLPLYTIWESGSWGENIFAAIHCTGGDVLIALSALTASLVLLGNYRWPNQTFVPVMILTIVIGLLYTAFSEWLNIEVRQSWAYRDLMPIIPGIGMGLSPFLQWIVIPSLAFWFIKPSK